MKYDEIVLKKILRGPDKKVSAGRICSAGRTLPTPELAQYLPGKLFGLVSGWILGRRGSNNPDPGWCSVRGDRWYHRPELYTRPVIRFNILSQILQLKKFPNYKNVF